MIADTPPAVEAPADSAPAPIFPGPDGTPQYLIGVNAYGTAEDIARLENAATRHGWPTQRENVEGGRIKLMIAFPGAMAAEVRMFLEQAARGDFGSFLFESAMAPLSAAGRNN